MVLDEMKHYACIDTDDIDVDCAFKNVRPNSLIGISIAIPAYGIGMAYEFTKDNNWIDYHKPPTYLTEKTSIRILLSIKDDKYFERYKHGIVPIIQNYDVTYLLLLKEIANIYLNKDILKVLFEVTS